MRAAPPGVASDPARWALFTSALEQGQQFMEAAESTGYATRPVQLFYGLSQLGRAVAAASDRLVGAESAAVQQAAGADRREVHEPWRLSGHGITVPRLRHRSRSGLAAVMVRGQAHGSLPGVARAIGSPSLPADRDIPVTDLWAMLPEAREIPLPIFEGKPLIVSCTEESEQPWDLAAGIPAGLMKTHVTLGGIPEDLESATLDDYLRWYPGLAARRPPDEVAYGGGDQVTLTWIANDYDVEMGWADGWDHSPALDLPTVDYEDCRCLVPVIGGMRESVHPLVLWWAVLFTLSILARYEPDTWSELIDINRSREADAIEQLLDDALKMVPNLVLDVLNDITIEDGY
jgi:hypothetical protein